MKKKTLNVLQTNLVSHLSRDKALFSKVLLYF